MRISTSLILGLLLVLFLNGRAPYSHNPEANCDRLAVNYSITNVGNNQVEISVTATGGIEPYRYLFLDKKNTPVNWDFDKSSIKVETQKLPKQGKVIDAEGCMKVFQFNESEIK